MAPSDTIACSICGRVKAHANGRPPYCRDCTRHARALRIGHWHTDALCRPGTGVDPNWWWPDAAHPQTGDIAIGICQSCPVMDECLTFAITNEETSGIWGGTTPEQRRRYRRAHERSA